MSRVASSSQIEYSGVPTSAAAQPRKDSDGELELEEEIGCFSFNPITFSYRPKIDKALVVLCFLSSILSLLIAVVCFESHLFLVEHTDSTGTTKFHYGWMRRISDGNQSHKSDYLVILDDQTGLTGFGFGIGHLIYAILLFYGFCHVCIYDPQHPSPYFRCLFTFFLCFICGLITTIDVIFPLYLFRNLNFHSQKSITPLWGCFATYLNLTAIWISVVFSCRLWLRPIDARKASVYEEKYDPSNYGMTKIRCPARDDAQGSGFKAKFRRFSESFSSISRISQFVPVHRHGSVTHSDGRPVEIVFHPRSQPSSRESSPTTGRVRSLSGVSDASSILKFGREDEMENDLDNKKRLASVSTGVPPTIHEASSGLDQCYISDWTAKDVGEWMMYMLRLPKYAQKFVDSGIDGRTLWTITDEKLRDMGVDDGAARSTILSAVLHMRVTPGGSSKGTNEVAMPNGTRGSCAVAPETSASDDEDSDLSVLEENGQGAESPSSKSSGNPTQETNDDEVVMLDL